MNETAATEGSQLAEIDAALLRWKNSHCDQLFDGECDECTALWKAIHAYTNGPGPFHQCVRSEMAPPEGSDLVLDVLDTVADFLEDRQDVRDGEDGTPLPNEAMSLLQDVKVAMSVYKRRAAVPSAIAEPVSKLVECPACKDMVRPDAPACLSKRWR